MPNKPATLQPASDVSVMAEIVGEGASAQVTWAKAVAVECDLVGYKLRCTKDADASEFVAELGGDATTHVFKEMEAGRTYVFELTARAQPTLVDQRVRIKGLQARPGLNGQCGMATAFDVASGRYTVQLEGEQMLKVKAANLEAVEREQADVDELLARSEAVRCAMPALFKPPPVFYARPALRQKGSGQGEEDRIQYSAVAHLFWEPAVAKGSSLEGYTVMCTQVDRDGDEVAVAGRAKLGSHAITHVFERLAPGTTYRFQLTAKAGKSRAEAKAFEATMPEPDLSTAFSSNTY